MATARTAVEYSVVITIVLAIQALTFTTQERISVNSGRGYDGTHYHAFAEQFAAGARPTGESRFVRRIGTPFLAAAVNRDDLVAAFEIVNGCAAFLSAVLLFAWLRRYVGTLWVQIALVVAYATHWLQLVRFTAFYPVLVDACAQTCCFAGLLCIASYEQVPSRTKVTAVAVISAVGVCFREVVLLIPLAFLFARNPGIRRDPRFPYVTITNRPALHQWIPLAFAAAALALVKTVIVVTDPKVSELSRLLARALSRSVLTYVLGWMVAFGPALFLIVFDWRNALGFFKRHRWVLVYFLGVAMAGWAGSLESERHAVNWAAPVAFVLIGRSIQHHCTRLRHSPALVGIALVQLLVNRVFWPIPQPADDYRSRDPAIVFTAVGPGSTYLHLFPDYLPRELAWLEFLEHAAVGLVVLALMRSREAELDTRAPVGSRLAAVLRQARTTTVAASLASGSGLRQLTTLGALKVVVPAFVMIATGGGLLVLVAQPKQPVPIHVRWTRNVDAPRRAALERQLQLSDGRRIEGTTWVYMLRDPSTDEIRTIVTHPDVDDTAHVNRIWFRPELAHDRHRRAILSGGVAGVAGAVVVLLWKAIRLAETRRERE